MSAVREIAITSREVVTTAALIALLLILAIKPSILMRILKDAGIKSVKLPGDLSVEIADIGEGLNTAKQALSGSQESMSRAQSGHAKLDIAVSQLLGTGAAAAIPNLDELANHVGESRAAVASTEDRLAKAQEALDTALRAQHRLAEKVKRAER